MEYLKVWTSFQEEVSMLHDDEAGRLFLAMLQYADTGEEPENLSGSERLLWPSARRSINATRKQSETNKGNAKTSDKEAKTSDIEATSSENERQTPIKVKVKDKVNKKENTLTGVREKMFEQFWSAYPRHEGKQNAQRAFDKLNVDEELLAKILSAIERQKQSSQWKENGGQYIPHPATWLNGHRWEDETQTYTATRPIRAVNAQQYSQRDYDDEDAEAYRRMLRKAVEEDALP